MIRRATGLYAGRVYPLSIFSSSTRLLSNTSPTSGVVRTTASFRNTSQYESYVISPGYSSGKS